MKVLLIVDLQRDFCPGGSLPADGANTIVPVVNKLIASDRYDMKAAAKERHPRDHGSFASQHPGAVPFEMGELDGRPQMLYADHCVADTPGAEFHPDLNAGGIDYIQHKGENRLVDSYSAFKDNAGVPTGLHEYLLKHGVTEIDVGGLVTEICVKFTALDAVSMLPGVKVNLITDACSSLTDEASETAIAEMSAAGISIFTSDDVLAA